MASTHSLLLAIVLLGNFISPLNVEAAPTTPSPEVRGRISLQVGLELGLEGAIGATEVPLLVNAQVLTGYIQAWRIGIESPAPSAAGMGFSAYTGLAAHVHVFFASGDVFLGSDLKPTYPNGPAFYLPADLDHGVAGIRLWLRSERQWFCVSPGLYLPLSNPIAVGDWMWSAVLGQSVGLIPPFIEWGHQFQPGMALVVRSSLPFLEVRFTL